MPSELERRQTALAAPSQTTTKKVDVLKLCKWAKKNGAVQIKVDGIEILFPPPDLQPDFQSSPATAEPGRQWLSEQMPGTAAPPPSTPKARPAINSEGDHPDVYARELDAWANQRPLGRR